MLGNGSDCLQGWVGEGQGLEVKRLAGLGSRKGEEGSRVSYEA